MDSVIQLIVVSGAAGAFFLVLRWIVEGKLHAKSEVDGLKADKKELISSNRELREANAEANKGLSEALELLRGIAERIELDMPGREALILLKDLISRLDVIENNDEALDLLREILARLDANMNADPKGDT